MCVGDACAVVMCSRLVRRIAALDFIGIVAAVTVMCACCNVISRFDCLRLGLLSSAGAIYPCVFTACQHLMILGGGRLAATCQHRKWEELRRRSVRPWMHVGRIAW